ncbi:hypothetical protein L6452_26706 [Arctium lappa]|uniref:Uncharacterized protein n=1 Tax=Arctium lappa TaxID=4217 RepID=A0ACB8ZU56_ARCLA|nr:hypothetical protein L6452_26706 [Arctium lappa]
MTPDWLKMLVGDTIQCTELQGWIKYRQSQRSMASFMELKNFRGVLTLGEHIVLKVNLDNSTQTFELMRKLDEL